MSHGRGGEKQNQGERNGSQFHGGLLCPGTGNARQRTLPSSQRGRAPPPHGRQQEAAGNYTSKPSAVGAGHPAFIRREAHSGTVQKGGEYCWASSSVGRRAYLTSTPAPDCSRQPQVTLVNP